MKFCKSLQRLAEISDPSYAPYWTNYKLLKKMIKVISGREVASIATFMSDPSWDSPASGPVVSPKAGSPQFRIVSSSRTSAGSAAATASSSARKRERREPPQEEDEMSALELDDGVERDNTNIRGNPQEVAFFRLVHAEVRKAMDFFDKVERECIMREQVVTVGMEILKKPQACMVEDRWSVISRAIFFLYRDLLLLETFAIMTYFSFSKILKKHDKVTGYSTRDPFMVNIVNKANFTNYPKLLGLISRCETLYNEASEKLVQDLHEDERLFLNMVSEWNTRNRDIGGAGSSTINNGREATAGLSTDTVRGVSHRSRTETPQPERRRNTAGDDSGAIRDDREETAGPRSDANRGSPLRRRRLPMASSRPLKKRVPYSDTHEGQGDDNPKKPRPSK